MMGNDVVTTVIDGHGIIIRRDSVSKVTAMETVVQFIMKSKLLVEDADEVVWGAFDDDKDVRSILAHCALRLAIMSGQ